MQWGLYLYKYQRFRWHSGEITLFSMYLLNLYIRKQCKVNFQAKHSWFEFSFLSVRLVAIPSPKRPSLSKQLPINEERRDRLMPPLKTFAWRKMKNLIQISNQFLESEPFKYILPNDIQFFWYIDDILIIYPNKYNRNNHQ